MELNVLNEKLNVDAGKTHQVNEYDFWLFYCKLLNIRNPVLTDKDCVILAHILTLPTGSSFLNKVNAVYLEDVTKTQLSNLFSKSKQLAEKGFVVKTDEGFFLHPNLQSFQSFVKEHKELMYKFTLPLMIQ